jgi:chain length determinant protein (polysaccharide antigen chain regulator)
MNTEQSQPNNDEIDLADLVRSLWDGKWVVINTTIATVIAALIYLIAVPKTYEGALEISPLPSFQAQVYLTFNETELISIDSKQFETLFIEDILKYEALEFFLKENSYLKKLENESELEFSVRISDVAREFTVSKPNNKTDREQQPKWTIALETQQPELATKVVSDALSVVNDNVNRQVQSTMDRLLDAYSRGITRELKDIDTTISIAINNEKLKTQFRLAFLDEQASLARAIGIDKNTLTAQTFTTQSALVTSVNKEDPFYLRGYIAIEKEMEILSSRQSPQLFIPEIISNELRKQQLLKDVSITTAKQLIALTPIGTEAFEAVSYDLASIDFQSKTKTSLILALSIVLGGMLGIFALLIRNAVGRKE